MLAVTLHCAVSLVTPIFDINAMPPKRQLIQPPPTTLADSSWPGFWEQKKQLKRVDLLKAIEASTAEIYEKEVLAKVTPDEKRERLRAVVLESNLAGIEEFGDEWFDCIRAKMFRMQLCAEFTVRACEQAGDECGFDAYERALIVGAAKMLPSYNQYYFDYLASVQDPTVLDYLKTNPPDPNNAEVFSSYTVVRLANMGVEAIPFAKHFAEPLAPVLACFDSWLSSCRAAESALADGGASGLSTPGWGASSRAAYTAFLQQYRDSLALEADAAALESAWNTLDRRWMDCKMPIQIVHDIETGYGDPLRVKATPDMSLRFLDDTYASENAVIADIQRRLEQWYTERATPLARAGLQALSNTFAGIYYIPFKTGISLQFSFSGQAIPNRRDVAEDKGIKIYFDAIETAARVEINKKLVSRVYHDASGPAGVVTRYQPEAVEQLVWHVAAHEVGHAIYNLAGVAEVFSSPAYESLLEEPRAELTAMFALRLLHDQGVLDRPKTDMALAHFALDALRYFDKYESEALRPYIIFQVYAYKVYHQHGYLTLHPESGQLVLDESKTLDVLDHFKGCFQRLLACMDDKDGPGLEKILFSEMAPEDDFVRAVVALVRAGTPSEAAAARPERGCACHPTWSLPACMVCQPVSTSK